MEAIVITLGTVALFFALGVVSLKNPVHSAVCLIAHMVALAALFIALNAEFLAMVQLIVYAGAVVVLFLFIIAYLGTSGDEEKKPLGGWEKKVVILFVLILVFELTWLIATSQTGSNESSPDLLVDMLNFGTTELLAHELYSRYLIPFELASVLLLVAAVGVLALVKKQEEPPASDEVAEHHHH